MSDRPTLLIATHNPGKLKEFTEGLKTSFLCQPPSQPMDVEETGSTYRANAALKAKAYFDTFGLPVLSDDSGLEVDALEGKPGVFSARFGGESLSWIERWEKLKTAMALRPETRFAQFRCVLCYFDGKHQSFFEGLAPGEIVFPPRGDKGFGYDPIFYSADLKKTFAEASFEEKLRHSHRGLALQAFLKWWAQGSKRDND